MSDRIASIAVVVAALLLQAPDAYALAKGVIEVDAAKVIAGGAPSTTVEQPAEAGAIQIVGRLGESVVDSGAPVTLILQVRNGGVLPIRVLALERFWGAGLAEAGNCWRGGFPLCGGGSPTFYSAGSPIVRPGQSQTFRGELQADEVREASSLYGAVNYERGGIRQSELIDFGTLTVKSRSIEASRWLLGALAAAAIAFLFERVLRRRAEVQQTWLQMVAKLHEYAEKFYMPLSGTVAGLRARDVALKKEKLTDDQRKLLRAEILPRLVSVACQMKSMGGFGGWYFHSRAGERAAECCWGAFYRCFALIRLGDCDLRRLSIAVRPMDHELLVAKKLERKSVAEEVSRVRAALNLWLEGDFSEALRFLHLLELIVDFEVNSAFSDWYGSKEKFPVQEFQVELRHACTWCEGLPDSSLLGSETTKADLKAICCQLFVYSEKTKRLQLESWSRRKFAKWSVA